MPKTTKKVQPDIKTRIMLDGGPASGRMFDVLAPGGKVSGKLILYVAVPPADISTSREDVTWRVAAYSWSAELDQESYGASYRFSFDGYSQP